MDRKNFNFLLVVLSLLLLIQSVPCFCQEKPFNPELDRHLKLGPFRLRPFFVIQDAGYDSNIYRRQTDVTSDFTATFSPGCDIFTYLGDRGKIFFKQQVDIVLFLKEDSQNHINNRSAAQIDFLLNRFDLMGKWDLAHLKERPNNEIDVRTRSTRNALLLSTIYKHSSKTSAVLSFSNTRIRYDDKDEFFGSALSDAYDRNEDSLIVQLSQKFFRKTTVTLESKFTDYDFHNDALRRDAKADYYLLGVAFDPEAIISGKLKIGHASFKPENPEYSNYNGSVGEASLTYRVTPLTRMTLTYGKEIAFTIYGGNLYYLENSYGFSIFQYLTRRIGIELGGTLYKNRYRNPQTIPLPEGGSFYGLRKDDVKTGSAAIKYKLNDQYTIGLKVSRWIRDSNLYTQDVDQTMIGTTVGYQF